MRYFIILAILSMLTSCTSYRKISKIRAGEVEMQISIPEVPPLEEETEVVIDSIRGTLSDGPIIMNAIRDSESGEMVATDVINASKVVARFRNVAERGGYVSIGFDIIVPREMYDSHWRLKMTPLMGIIQDTVALEPLYITGSNYREGQLRGYQRYNSFIASILTDTTDFVRMKLLEVFLQRHFPETYAMKRDSSVVPEPMAGNYFGVTQKEALEHYTRHLKWKINERKKDRRDEMFHRYVKDPIQTEGVRLDTIVDGQGGDFIYRYTQTFKSRPKLKKVSVSVDAALYEEGEVVLAIPFPEDITFYVSSLSSLADQKEQYKMKILERVVYDNTRAFIDFAQGSSVIDTSLSDNGSELRRIKDCINDVVSRTEFVLDSLVIIASCSPEGTFEKNRRLSMGRSESVKDYILDFVPPGWRDSVRTSEMPENWDQLLRLVDNDTILSPTQRKDILSICYGDDDKDVVERRISQLPQYRYLREKLYPQLRTVSFDFYLRRPDLKRDTVYTTEIDTAYMSGLEALRELDYKKAVSLLRPYRDFNSALAFAAADYNHSALDVLDNLDDADPKVCYLKAVVLARLELYDEAMKYFELGIAYDPYLEHRANLDPEMGELIKRRKLTIK